jgi:peptidoglycan hydrolase-like protein with peptidoglycan-binding domain
VSGLGWFRRERSVPVGWRRRGRVLTAVGAGLVLAAGISIATFAAPGSHAAAISAADQTAAKAGAKTGAKAAGRKAAPQLTGPLQVVSVTPANGSGYANGALPIKIVFSAPLAANSPMPTLSPHIAGSWRATGNAAVFTPAAGYLSRTKVTISIPGGAAGVAAAGATQQSTTPGYGYLASSVKETFTTGWFSTLRLQQLLAQLGYLPLTWTPASGGSVSPGDASGQLAAAYQAPQGTFSWQSGYPSVLHGFWKQGAGNMIDVGAIRAFENDQGLTMDGYAGSTVWQHLLSAIAKGQSNKHGYTYALASKASPETLTIWHNGRQVLRSLANTGISVAPTAAGTYPVYLRYYYQVMKGTNPDGSKYSDPVYWVAYFNGGDAVHYFPRYSFGYPQSLGCVELPWDAAKKAWPYLTYGSLVTVTS